MTARAGRVPTARLAGLLAAAAVAILAAGAGLPARAAGPAATGLLLAVGVAAAVDALRAPRARDLVFSRSIAGPLRFGRPAAVRLRLAWLAQRAGAGTTVFWTDGTPPEVAPEQPSGQVRLGAGLAPVAIHYQVQPRRRGQVRWSGPLLAARSPMGLWQTVVRAGGATARTVYPGAATSAGAPGDRFVGRAMGTGDAGLEFDGVRPYVSGEDARRIHWRASARRDQPVVRLLRPERGRRLLLAVDAGRWSAQALDASGTTRLDAFTAAALEVAAAALAAGDSVGMLLLTAPAPARPLAPRPGPAALGPLAQALAAATPGDGDPDAVAAVAGVARSGADVVLWFTELPSPVDSAEWLRRLPALARRLPVVVVCVRAAGPPQPSVELAAAAAELEAVRGQTLARLRRGGVPAWDGPPERCGALALAAYRHCQVGVGAR